MIQRIINPFVKDRDSFEEISFENAFTLIHKKLNDSEIDDTLVMCSGDYSNETLYQIQKLARTTLKTNALSSFDYYNRGFDFFADKNDIVPFAEFYQADHFFCMFDENSEEKTLQAVFEIFKHCPKIPKYWFNNGENLKIKDNFSFFRAINWYILQNNLEKGIYVQGLGKNYSEYKNNILNENFNELLEKNNLQLSQIQDFVTLLLNCANPVIIVWEPYLTASAFHELENLCMLIEIQAKPAAGFICIKKDLNSQGLFDMGIFSEIAPGGETINPSVEEKMRSIFENDVYVNKINISQSIKECNFKKSFLWNCAGEYIPQDVINQVKKCEFSILQTAYFTEQAQDFDLIIPANLPEEMSGTYTDSARVPHNFEFNGENILKYNNLQQISEIAKQFGLNFSDNKDEIFLEYISFMRAGCRSANRHFFK